MHSDYSQRAKTRITIEKKDNCLTIGCSFGADCVLDEDGLEPYCRCTHQCNPNVHHYVCGNDNVTYPSSCHLQLSSCKLQQTIYVKHEGNCHEIHSKCVESDCKFGAHCIQLKGGLGSECRCPEKCLDYPDVVTWLHEKYPHSQSESLALTNEPVCGIDGRDYENLCQLKKISCLQKKLISVKYFGLCDPCSTMMCPSDEICQLDIERKPFCTCNYSTCSTMDLADHHNNDGLTGEKDNNGPNNNHLYHNQEEPSSITTTTTSTTTVATMTLSTYPLINETLICGSDGNLYKSECSLFRESCVKKIDIKPSPSSNCIQGHHPCHKLKCHFHGKCIVDKFGSAKCTCLQCESIYKPICGSNRITYDSVCHLLRDSCLKKVNLTVSYSGPCENYQQVSPVINGLTNGLSISGLQSNRSTSNAFVSCSPDNCHFGGVCVQTKEFDNQLKSVCQCRQCPDENEPVCGSNGVSYANECELHKASCQDQKAIYISHKGPCRSCDKLKCKYYAICEANIYGIYECVCPQVCLRLDAPICGSNGVTYDNECELRVRSCLAQTDITIAHLGPCDSCQKIVCKNGAQCENGRCVCPTSCSDPVYEPICANDGNTYPNECEMRKNACLNDMDLRSLFYGQCEETEDEPTSSDDNSSDNNESHKNHQTKSEHLTQPHHHRHQNEHKDFKSRDSDAVEHHSTSVASRDSKNPCQRLKCNFGGVCEFNNRGRPYCECKFNCSTMIRQSKGKTETVCGSDGRYYENLCSLKEESCRRQIEIKSVDSDQCNLSITVNN
uniref:Kazal-like domain-containing protein n=1 Tax=Tetranychus urticae TaxID=32264 RepID=T1KV29_TETUR